MELGLMGNNTEFLFGPGVDLHHILLQYVLIPTYSIFFAKIKYFVRKHL